VPNPSAGLLLYRLPDRGRPVRPPGLEVLLVHPGGPLWRRKDEGAWSIPKGEIEPGDEPRSTAEREFTEELGLRPPPGPRIDLGEITQRGGKRVRAWAVAGDLDVTEIHSNTFEMQWPPGSGRTLAFPEVDRAGWFSVAEARVKLVDAQAGFLDRLTGLLDAAEDP
jgi:predicted NUDIX family NTP pyrophosphohydrolase